ncbi:MAG TPA: universal stress protein [Gammaproteobacteria bacterium]|nr:universal stress protein [Gammaproteobacteria bacterium]
MNQKNTCIIAALNLSNELEAVVETARKLADCMQLPVRLLHVISDQALIEISNEYGLGDALGGGRIEQGFRDEYIARHKIGARLDLADSQLGELEILTGHNAKTLEQRARELHAAVIVAGQPETHFGSVVSHLARHAPCDVYIVRTNSE